jgi:hypothetical protein
MTVVGMHDAAIGGEGGVQHSMTLRDLWLLHRRLVTVRFGKVTLFNEIIDAGVNKSPHNFLKVPTEPFFTDDRFQESLLPWLKSDTGAVVGHVPLIE